MIVFAFGFWAWSPHKADVVETAPTYLAQLERERDEIAQSARTPHEKLKHTARMAERLWRNARDLAYKSNPNRLAALVDVYSRLVMNDMPTYARALTPIDRQETLHDIREQLTRADSELRGLIAEAQLQIEVANQLQRIAQAARESHATLGELLV